MISILGNIGNSAFALPMVQAYPVDVNVQQLLAWDPTDQALDYVPYTGNSSGDFGVGRDLSVVRNATIAGTLGVTGIATFAAVPVFTGGLGSPSGVALTMTGVVQGLSLKAVSGANNAELLNNQLNVQATKVIGARITGWGDPTGTATRTTFATGSVTLPQLAERMMALILDLKTHGLIGT